MMLSATGVLVAVFAGAAIACGLERLLAAPGHEADAGYDPDLRRSLTFPNADRWLLPAAPVVALCGIALGMVVVPFGPGLIGRDLGIAAFYFIVVIDFVVLGIALAGWGANTSDSVEACYRIIAQLVAYIVPLGLAYVGVIMMSRSLSTVAITKAQSHLWFVVLQPIGFLLYVVSGLMQCYRAPFLEPFATMINGGVLGASGGWSALLWRTTLSGLLFLVASMGTVLYLGGPAGPLLPGWTWMLIKTCGLMALMIWAGQRFRLLSTSEMLALSWKLLTPVGMFNVLLVGALILLGIGPTSQ